MTVNLEGFVLYNAAMNALLLLFSGRLSGLRPRILRIAIAALIGAAYAVASNMTELLFLQDWYMKILLAALMAAIAFVPDAPKRLLRAAGCFFLSAFLLGGTGFSLMYLLGARGFGWQIAGLIIALGAAGIVLLGGGLRRMAMRRAIQMVRIDYRGKRTRVPALIDTGNALMEGISGLPVLVVERRCVKGWPASEGRPVAFHSVGGDGLMPTFEPDGIFIRGKPQRRMRVAVYPGSLSADGQYAALLPWPVGMEKGGDAERNAEKHGETSVFS